MKQNRLIALVLSVATAMSAMGVIAMAQDGELRIEAPSKVISGEKFKIVVTYEREPAYNARITFEGAVVTPTETDHNGVALITAPDVTEPTKVTMNVKYHHNSDDYYDYVTINVIPSETLFEGTIKIAENSFWAGNYHVTNSLNTPTDVLSISVKTDGRTVHLFVLNQTSFSNYLKNKQISMKDYRQSDIIEGNYLWETPLWQSGQWYVVLENPHDVAVTVSLEVSKAHMP